MCVVSYLLWGVRWVVYGVCCMLRIVLFVWCVMFRLLRVDGCALCVGMCLSYVFLYAMCTLYRVVCVVTYMPNNIHHIPHNIHTKHHTPHTTHQTQYNT